MRETYYRVAVRSSRLSGLVFIAALLGCQGGTSETIPMPKKIIDLSPVITQDLPVREFGHRGVEGGGPGGRRVPRRGLAHGTPDPPPGRRLPQLSGETLVDGPGTTG